MTTEERDALVEEWLDIVAFAIFVKEPTLSSFARVIGTDDALQAGRLGLVMAASSFDEAKGKFPGYAIKAVRWAVCSAYKKRERVRGMRRIRIKLQSIPDYRSSPEINDDMPVIEKALSFLPENRRKILMLRFGFGCEPHTLEAIAEKMGITRERVRQLAASALYRLKDNRFLQKLI